MKQTKKFWIALGTGVAIFFLIILISDIIETGERIRKLHPYLEYGFYGLSVILFYFLIFNPIRIILFSPSFNIVTIFDEDNKKNIKVYHKVIKTLEKNNSIDENDRTRLNSCETIADLREELSKVFNEKIKRDINKIIRKTATTVMISTAICQNGKLDMYTVVTLNIKMIKEIVQKCGFRPTYPKIGKLAVRVFSTALIAESLDGLNISELFPQTSTNILAEVPMIKPIASSIASGISNALLTLRVGIVTRNYLFSESRFDKKDKVIIKNDVRVKAIKESLSIIPGVVKDVLAYFPNKIANLFFKKKTTDTE